VEVAENDAWCPLCNTKIPDPVSMESDSPKKEVKESRKTLYTKEINYRQVAWETLGILMAFASAICLFVDLLISRQISWSRYVLSSLGFAWLILTVIYFLYKRAIALSVCSALTILAYLFVLDWIDSGLEWFSTLGLPITLFSMASAYAVWFLSIKSQKRGLNVVAYFLFAVVINCLVIEGAVNFYLSSRIFMNWSLIVALSVIPEAVIFLYLHYRLLRHREVKRYFHF
jgi:hypothetical protein